MIKEAFIVVIVITLTNIVSSSSLPEISSLPDEVTACENSYFSYDFEVFSEFSQLEVDVAPKEIFFVGKNSENQTKFEIFSANLSKSQSGKTYNVTVYAKNPSGLNFKKVKINVVEVNNAPLIEDLRVQTVSLEKNSSFSRKVFAKDIEDGIESDKFLFESKFKSAAEIFEISDGGLIQFSADKTKLGVYLAEICVRDSGLFLVDPLSSFCNEDGSPKISCDEFQLTITEKNRQPTVISKIPTANINTTVGKNIDFFIATFDPDGTSADVYWYVDGYFKEFDSGLSSLEKNFSQSFECNKSGTHEIKAEITDGLINDSVIWMAYAQKDKNCTNATTKSIRQCDEKWACSDWDVCQNAVQSLELGVLPEQEYQKISLDCDSSNLDENSCGFQIKSCVDIFGCGDSELKPTEIKACEFVLNPSCSDQLVNCHDGSCEISIGCGGPCSDCASCFDRIENQNEDGVDCGGVCPVSCPSEESIARKKIVTTLAKIAILVLSLILLFKLFKVLKTEKELSKYNEK